MSHEPVSPTCPVVIDGQASHVFLNGATVCQCGQASAPDRTDQMRYCERCAINQPMAVKAVVEERTIADVQYQAIKETVLVCLICQSVVERRPA